MLTEQDRTLWDAAAIAEGRQRLDAATRLGRPGPFQLQAAIAACHVRQGGTTNWAEIANLYDLVKNDGGPANHVFQSLLRGESDRNAADTKPGQGGVQVDPEEVKLS